VLNLAELLLGKFNLPLELAETSISAFLSRSAVSFSRDPFHAELRGQLDPRGGRGGARRMPIEAGSAQRTAESERVRGAHGAAAPSPAAPPSRQHRTPVE
jgi:hypothetical protein